MAVRIQFSTHYPERMGEKAGQRNYFPEKVISGVVDNRGYLLADHQKHILDCAPYVDESILDSCTPKTSTIRKNYDYWKSKEGQMIQPFFWEGKPYRSKHVVFCPEVKLERVMNVKIVPKYNMVRTYDSENMHFGAMLYSSDELSGFIQSEGFDSAEDFFMWFNEDYEGALLEF